MFLSPGGAHPPPDELFAGRYAVDGQLPWGGLVSYYRGSAEGTPLIICIFPMDVSRSRLAEAAFSQLTQSLGRIQCRSIPRVLDAGLIDGVPDVALQDTRGTPLSHLLRDRKLPSVGVLRIASDVLQALEAAHAQGLAHGDVTPENVIITRESDGALAARVIGTGVVPLLRACPEASAHAAHTGSGKHAVAYMAPELIGTGAFPLSADLYSVGALLHHMVLGSPPVGWETDEGFEDIPALPDVIRRAMAKRPEGRYPDATSMLAALGWVEVESAKLNPQTQDIAPWMESSRIGSIPVPTLASSLPPAHVSSNHPAGTVLSVSGPRPRPKAPIIVQDATSENKRHWVRIALLLVLLGTLVFSGYWWTGQRSANQEALSPDLAPATEYVE